MRLSPHRSQSTLSSVTQATMLDSRILAQSQVVQSIQASVSRSRKDHAAATAGLSASRMADRRSPSGAQPLPARGAGDNHPDTSSPSRGTEFDQMAALSAVPRSEFSKQDANATQLLESTSEYLPIRSERSNSKGRSVSGLHGVTAQPPAVSEGVIQEHHDSPPKRGHMNSLSQIANASSISHGLPADKTVQVVANRDAAMRRLRASGADVQRIVRACVMIQACWRGFYARCTDVRCASVRREIRTRRTEKHIQLLSQDVDK